MVVTDVFWDAETTISSIGAVIYFLMKNRATMMKLQQEIDQTCNEHSWPSDVPVPSQLTKSIRYLQAVVYESIQLFPANGMPLARVSPPEGLEIDGHYSLPGVQATVYCCDKKGSRAMVEATNIAVKCGLYGKQGFRTVDANTYIDKQRFPETEGL